MLFEVRTKLQSVSWIWTSLTWLILVMVFSLVLNFAAVAAASKNDTYFKSGQEWLEIDHLALLV